MSVKTPPADLPTQAFATSSDFATYLDANHLTAPGLYVKFAKKNSQIPSITPADAVETALCYGWIDGRANSIDETWWTVRYTPRRAKSIWSQKNVATIARLIEEGKMKPAGLAQVQAAKSDGRWEKAYAGPKDMVVPDDLLETLSKEGLEDVREYWEALNKSSRYPYLHKLAIVSAKGREKKIESVVLELTKAAQVTAKDTQDPESTRATTKAKKSTSVKMTKKQSATQRPKGTPAKLDQAAEIPRRTGLRTRTGRQQSSS